MASKKGLIAGVIVSNREIEKGHFLMTLQVPESFAAPLPGQFVMIRIPGKLQPFLGRPLSVYDFHRRDEKGLCEILYKVVGQGTLLLSKLKKREAVDILGPLGHPFTPAPPDKKIVLVAGGMGIAPMTYLAAHCRSSKAGSETKMVCYVGARSAASLLGIKRMQIQCETKIGTDDGSRGYHGVVTELLKADLPSYDAGKTLIYACGPRPMLKQLASICRESSFSCEASLEERMACGVGVCLGCVTAVNDAWGKKKYRRVCTEGPVFNINDVIWDG